MADRKLKTYQSKRDFKVTAEPSGAERVAPSRRLRFVIQKHDATRLHYDLRLELDGVFKSWAVTKGPSLDPHVRRLAVEVEDHPLDYGDFEGTIPAGQYGGGTVMLWDRGDWAPADDAPAARSLEKGHLSFVLEGERLHGQWALVRLRSDRDKGKRVNWLLIKHGDEAAHEDPDDAFLKREDHSVASSRSMDQIAEGKGRRPKPFMKPGAAPEAADAVWHSNRKEAAATPPHGQKAGALPRFVPPQLCKLVDRPPSGGGWGHEVKFDGYRLQLRVEDGKARALTRKGLDWTARFPEIAADAAKLPEGLYDGEAVALDHDGKPDFAALQAALSSEKTGELVMFLFDALFMAGEDLRELSLEDRKARLELGLKSLSSPRLRYVEHFVSAGDAVLKSACSMDLEGIVSKRLDAPYRSGRGEAWTKAKCRGGQEVVIGGWTTNPDGAFRSLIAGVQRDGRLIHVGRIGTGFGREVVARLLPRLEAVEAKTSPFKGSDAPAKAAGVHWVRPDLVAEIAFAGWTGDGHLRQASFKALREDKPAAEIVAERTNEPTDGPKMDAPEPAAPKAKGGSPIVLGVSITNPGKAYWPAHAGAPEVTKLDLARYIEAVAAWMLPHIAGRPCSLVRTPDGIGGQHFFQRHAGSGTSSLITLTKTSADPKPYLQLDSAEALIAAVQSGATEFHPWNCAPGAPDTPGRLVFDLDPAPDVEFGRVIEAARELRDRLDALGLVGFCKTTGGKGLHVVTPLKPGKLDWEAAKAFARGVSEQMALDSPDRYLVNMSKAKRVGKIFLDYLRNDRTATAVAPLSSRARPGATVSMPLVWTQVRAGLDPARYTVTTAAALIADSRAWEDYDQAQGALSEAIRRLGRPRQAA